MEVQRLSFGRLCTTMFEVGEVGRCGAFEQPGRSKIALFGGSKRVRAAIPSAPAEPSRFERPFPAFQRSRAGLSGNFGRPAEPSGIEVANVSRRRGGFEQAGRKSSSALTKPIEFDRVCAAISSNPAEPSGLERSFRATQRSRACSKSETSTGTVLASNQAEQFRAFWRNRASSSGHLDRPSRAERVRAVISNVPAEPSGPERPFRAPQRNRAGSNTRNTYVRRCCFHFDV